MTSHRDVLESGPARSTRLNQRAWLAGLRIAVAVWREAHPLPSIDVAPPRLRAMAQLQGAGFIEFVQDAAPDLCAERAALPAFQGEASQQEPALIWITDVPGMVAAEALLEPDAERLLAVPEEVFDAWMEQEPDWACQLHIEKISVFAPLSSEQQEQLSTQERAMAGEWMVHRVGLVWAENAGHEAQHLWRWHHGELSLVHESFGGALVY